ncbi:ubiquitin-like modifier-activating enzyme 5 [Aix galericulata]|nr:ubiquitin-like modifier-activating enzyme 5 [Aix galericulata]
MAELRRLQRRLRELEEELARERGGRGAPRARIEAMSAEVTDSNPYSRLMALKRMGIVQDYEVENPYLYSCSSRCWRSWQRDC